jgi:hypothetical protein
MFGIIISASLALRQADKLVNLFIESITFSFKVGLIAYGFGYLYVRNLKWY